MAKQIYIDENGNPIEVSGTVNTAELLPISGNDPTDTKTYIDTGLSGKADKSTLLSDIVKKIVVSGTTNSTGDIVADTPIVGTGIIISATKVRNASNMNIGFTSLARNAVNDRYIIHLQDASGSPLASQNVEVIVHYINTY